MMNEFQRRVLAEAAKFGGKFVSNSEKIANKLNEAPAIGAGGMSGLFGYSKQQFEMKMRQLIQKMGFEKGITRMDITDRGMTLHFANAAKARDFVITFNGLTKRQSKGSAASISTSFDKAKAPMGSNAVVTVDFSMMKMEGIENPSHLFMVLEALHEEYVGESATKAAIEDFMYDTLTKAAIAELKPIVKSKTGNRMKKIEAVLKKHKIPTTSPIGGKSAQLVADYFDSFHGESVEVDEAFRFRQQDWERMRAKYTRGTPVNIVLKKGKTVSGELLRMDKYDRGTADQGYMLWVRTSGGNVRVEDVDVKSIQWNNDPKTKMSEEANLEEAKLPKGFKKGEMLWLPGTNKRGQLIRWEPVDGVVGGMFTLVLPDKTVRHIKAQDIFRANSTKLMTKKEEVEVAEQFKAGDKVKVPHKGKMVRGRIVRFDNGGSGNARQHGGGYVVDVGEPASILVPKQKVQREEVEVNEAAMNNYIAFYNRKKIEVQAETLYKALVKAASVFKVPANKQHMIAVQIAGNKAAFANNEEVQVDEDVEEAYAPLDTPNIIGAFTEASKKKRFEYRKSTNKWGISHDLPHEVCVKETSPSEWRAANVKGTVCYIATDEGEGGKPVIEKWAIRNHVKYVKAESVVEEDGAINEATQKEYEKIAGNLAAKSTLRLTAKAAQKASTKELTKLAVKYGYKETLGKVPLVGMALGAVFAWNRFVDKDILGACVELVGGIVSTLPGFGTAAAFAIDGLLAARDMAKIKQMNLDLKRVKAKELDPEVFKSKYKLHSYKVAAVESNNSQLKNAVSQLEEEMRMYESYRFCDLSDVISEAAPEIKAGMRLYAKQDKKTDNGSVVKGQYYKVVDAGNGLFDLIHQSTGYRKAMHKVTASQLQAMIQNKVF